MARLSEERVQRLEAWAGEAMGEFVSISDIAIQFAELRELVRGYRHTVALEDMLREWLDSANLYSDIPLMERTEALLAEGDQ